MSAAEPAAAARRPAQPYRRREPEQTLLYETVRAHWKTFLAETEQRNDGAGLPRFVAAEFERYLGCGILANGFARVRCTSCGDALLVAFSCKGRGFCPSCTTRRMQGTATHLIDRVLPHVPMRQWVLSLPRWARFLLARDARLITRALDVALRAIFAFQRGRARRSGHRGSQTGAITFVQRFGGAVNLNVHFHSVVPDGVFVREGGAVRFVQLSAPTDEDVKLVLHRIARRLRKLLRPRADAAKDDARPLDPLGAAQAESVTFLLGKPADAAAIKRQTAYLEGFSLHAAVHLHANDREGLARLCGYGARPPLTQERLSALPDGRLAYSLKRPLADGRSVLVLTPGELLRRLASLVPPPRHHLSRYHGVFGPASSWRSEVIPPPPAPAHRAEADTPTLLAEPPDAAPTPASNREGGASASNPRPPGSQIPWAELLLRVFREDVLSCPCGGRRVVLAFLTDKTAVQQILDHLGLPTAAPPIAPARWPAAQEFAGWQDDVPELQQSLR